MEELWEREDGKEAQRSWCGGAGGNGDSGSGSAQPVNNAGLVKLLAKGVPTVTFTAPTAAGTVCPGLTCSTLNACDTWSFTAPILLTIDQQATNSTISAGCIQIDTTVGFVANGVAGCTNADGSLTITKPSGTYSVLLGGQLCFNTLTTTVGATAAATFHMGYDVHGGTGPHTTAFGSGDFNMVIDQIINSPGVTPGLGTATGVAVDMGGNIIP